MIQDSSVSFTLKMRIPSIPSEPFVRADGLQDEGAFGSEEHLFQCPGELQRSFRHILGAEAQNTLRTWGYGGMVQKYGTPNSNDQQISMLYHHFPHSN